ncbi:MAG: hypothetical protein GF392_04300, partial [Candidatus Omnitrophica bacterium]|nr:hypothetical protein [Candidatus Omnitrophota bacterium]
MLQFDRTFVNPAAAERVMAVNTWVDDNWAEIKETLPVYIKTGADGRPRPDNLRKAMFILSAVTPGILEKLEEYNAVIGLSSSPSEGKIAAGVTGTGGGGRWGRPLISLPALYEDNYAGMAAALVHESLHAEKMPSSGAGWYAANSGSMRFLDLFRGMPYEEQEAFMRETLFHKELLNVVPAPGRKYMGQGALMETGYVDMRFKAALENFFVHLLNIGSPIAFFLMFRAARKKARLSRLFRNMIDALKKNAAPEAEKNIDRVLAALAEGDVRKTFEAHGIWGVYRILMGFMKEHNVKPGERLALLKELSGRYLEDQEKRGIERRSGPAAIPSDKKLIAPRMSLAEYAVRVAPRVEEALFFTLPLVAGSLLGLGALWFVVLMAGARGMFFFLHEGARPHAPPERYAAPLKVAAAGFALSLLPVLASPAAGDVTTYGGAALAAGLIALTTILSVYTHTRENIAALLRGDRTAVIGEKREDIQDLRIRETPFYRVWRKILDGERPEVRMPGEDIRGYLESVDGGKELLRNIGKMRPPLEYIFGELTPGERERALKGARELGRSLGINRDWTLRDFEKMHAVRSLGRNLLVVMNNRKDIPETFKNSLRGTVYALGMMALLMENSVISVKLRDSIGDQMDRVEPFLIEGALETPENVDTEAYAAALASKKPYNQVFEDMIRHRLEGEILFRMPVEGRTMWAFTNDSLPFVIKVIKIGGKNSFGDPADFERDIMPRVDLARTRLGGISANILPIRKLRVNADGEEEVFGEALIQRKVTTIVDKFNQLRWKEDDPEEEIRAKKDRVADIIDQWFELQAEMHRRGVVDRDPRITDNYGFDEATGRVVILDFSHITDDLDVLKREDDRPVAGFGLMTLQDIISDGNPGVLAEAFWGEGGSYDYEDPDATSPDGNFAFIYYLNRARQFDASERMGYKQGEVYI